MAEPAGLELPGTFGEADYDPDEQTWNFSRVLERKRVLTLVEDQKSDDNEDDAAQEALEEEDEPSDDEVRSSTRHDRQIKQLLRQYPELHPASILLPDLLRTSEAINAAIDHHDPARGRLLAFGAAASHSRKTSIPIAVFAAGFTGSEICVREVQKQRQGWLKEDGKKDQSVSLEVPVIYGEETMWKGEGAPIRQIACAEEGSGSGTLLAARLHTGTVLLRPVVRRSGALELNEVCDISARETAHADMAFCPWYARQLATVDEAACWDIWELPSSAHDVRNQPKLVQSGYASPLDVLDGETVVDGWARVTFVCSTASFVIAVATRRELRLIDTSDSIPKQLPVVGLALSDADWILDMQLLPDGNTTHLFVLTSGYICILHVDPTVGASVIYSSKHWRDTEDTSLSTSLFLDDDNDVVILLTSSLYPLTTSFRLRIFEEDNVVESFDTVDLHLPRYRERVLDLHIRPLRCTRSSLHQPTPNSTAELYQSQGIDFYHLTALLAEGIVKHWLYCAAPTGEAQSVGIPTWKSKLKQSASRVEDDFVVDDDDFEAVPSVPPPPRIHRRTETNAFSLDFSVVCAALEKMSLENLDISTLLANVDLASQDEYSRRTLFGLKETTSDLTVDDPEAVDVQLQNLIQGADDHDLEIQQTEIGYARSLAEVYDEVVANWIEPLGPKITGRTRVAKDKLARQIAAEIVLASHVIVSKPPPAAAPEIEHEELTSSLPLPISQQSALPTPSPSATPTATPSVISSHSQRPRALELHRLSKYTTVNTRKHLRPLANATAAISSHWALGTDPDKYDYVSIAKAQARAIEEVKRGEGLTVKEKESLKRKSERFLKRQRREAEASQRMQEAAAAMHPTSSLGAMYGYSGRRAAGATGRAMGGSQPTAAQAASSSQSLGLGASTQVEAGPHGGRRKKVKRRAGF